MSKVELHQAFFWTCDHCGHDNFEFGVTIDTSMSDSEEIDGLCEKAGISREEYDAIQASEDGGGLFIIGPERVICDGCETEFEAER